MYQMLTIIPIIFGVGLSTATETEMNFFGLIGGFISTGLFVLSNVLTKTLLSDKRLKDLELALYCDITSLIMMLPIWLYSEIFTIDLGVLSISVILIMLFNGFCSFVQTICSFLMMGSFSSLTYALLNISKRVVVIVGSVVYFGTSLSPMSMLGTTLALAGIFMYSRAK